MSELLFIKTLETIDYNPGVALDIGANFGSYTGKIAEKFSQVYAFEPHPYNFEKLTTNVCTCSNVEFIQKAIGWYDGKIKLTVAEIHGEHSIHPDIQDRSGRLKKDFIEVDCITLDTFCADKPNVAFIKCDVESGENYIFRPECAGKTLSSQNITIALETHIEVDLERLYDDLCSYGYRHFLIEEGIHVTRFIHDAHYIVKKS